MKKRNNWMKEHLNDPYVKKAQIDNYRARSAYKLQEIDEKFKLFSPGQIIMDLGAAPGAWCQYVSRKLESFKKKPKLIALDLLEFEPIFGVDFIQGDFKDPSILAQLAQVLNGSKLDVLLSDMAPNLTGIASSDSAFIEELILLFLDFAKEHLHHQGSLVCKLFQIEHYSDLVRLFKLSYHEVKIIKPKASRPKSSEFYLLARKMKNK